MKPSLRLLPLLAGLLAGCAHTPKDFYNLGGHQVTATNDISDAIYASTEASIAKNPALLDEARKAHIANVAEAKKEFERVNARVRAMEAQWDTLLTGLAQSLGVSPLVGLLGPQLGLTVNRAVDTAKAAAADTKGLAAEVKRQEEKLQQAEAKLKENQTALEARDKALAELKSVLKEQAEAAQAEFAKLDDKTKAKAKEEIIAVLAERGLSPTEIDRLKSMTPEELMALLGGGGTISAAAIAAFLRSYGRSRAEPELATLRAEMQSLKVDVARKA